MIKINLLPPELTKGKKTRSRMTGLKASSGSTPYILLLVLLYLVTGGFGFWVINKKLTDDRIVKQKRMKRDRIKARVQEKESQFKELIELKALLDNQIEIIESLDPENRILWSEKLNMLADIVPKGVYLTNLNLTEHIKNVETEDSRRRRIIWEKSDKKKPPPPVTKRPVITQTFIIRGVTWADDNDQRIQLITDFHDRLKAYQTKGYNGKIRSFMDNFQTVINIKGIREETMAGRTITRFVFTLKTRPFKPSK